MALDVRTNDHGDLVVTKGDQYDVREKDDTADNNNNNTLSSNVNYCEKCYCFICDKLGKCVWGRTIRGLICGNDKTLFVKTRLCLFICLFYVSIRIIKSHTNTFTHCPFLYIPLI